jgi:hypothetical protein
MSIVRSVFSCANRVNKMSGIVDNGRHKLLIYLHAHDVDRMSYQMGPMQQRSIGVVYMCKRYALDARNGYTKIFTSPVA